jgi:hypothetical protein
MRDAASERRRVIDKLLRELARCEARAVRGSRFAIAARGSTAEPRRGALASHDRGASTSARSPLVDADPVAAAPPVLALRAVGDHAAAMRPRLELALDGHDLPPPRASLGGAISAVRNRVVERMIDAERAFRSALLELRRALDVVRVLRQLAREEHVFALVRWCDDWLVQRRPLVARVEAQLSWFGERDRSPAPVAPPPPPQPADHASDADVARRSHPDDPGTPGARSNDQHHP